MNWHVRYFLVHCSTKISTIQFKMTSRSTYPAKESPFPFIKGLAFWPPCTWNQDIELQASKVNALDTGPHWEPSGHKKGSVTFQAWVNGSPPHLNTQVNLTPDTGNTCLRRQTAATQVTITKVWRGSRQVKVVLKSRIKTPTRTNIHPLTQNGHNFTFRIILHKHLEIHANSWLMYRELDVKQIFSCKEKEHTRNLK